MESLKEHVLLCLARTDTIVEMNTALTAEVEILRSENSRLHQRLRRVERDIKKMAHSEGSQIDGSSPSDMSVLMQTESRLQNLAMRTSTLERRVEDLIDDASQDYRALMRRINVVERKIGSGLKCDCQVVTTKKSPRLTTSNEETTHPTFRDGTTYFTSSKPRTISKSVSPTTISTTSTTITTTTTTTLTTTTTSRSTTITRTTTRTSTTTTTSSTRIISSTIVTTARNGRSSTSKNISMFNSVITSRLTY